LIESGILTRTASLVAEKSSTKIVETCWEFPDTTEKSKEALSQLKVPKLTKKE